MASRFASPELKASGLGRWEAAASPSRAFRLGGTWKVGLKGQKLPEDLSGLWVSSSQGLSSLVTP